MKIRMVVPILGLLTLLAVDTKAAKLKDDFEGTWNLVARVVDGKAHELNEDDKKGELVAAAGELYVMKGGEKREPATYKLDATKTPKTIAITPTDGPAKGKVIQGVYLLDGDVIKMCLSADPAKVPTEFTSKEGSGHILLTMKRAKP